MRFTEIFTKVWLKAMTPPSNIISGFRATGIFPFDPDVIPDSAFAPSFVTLVEERPLEQIATEDNNNVNRPATSTPKNNSKQST